jgi:RES domain-containing protein
MLLYRLAKTKRAADLTGEGAKRVGGRWNHIGTPAVYTAESGSLAILEVLQYAEVKDIYNFSMLIISIPDNVQVQRVTLAELPDNWLQYPHPDATKDIGQKWIDEGIALLLEVPSAVYPNESNFLINPFHTDAKHIRMISVEPFLFSERLFKSYKK